MSQTWTSYLPQRLRERMNASPIMQKLLRNTGWLLADRVLRLGIGFFVGIWVSRYLGPEQFGFYNYLLAVVGLLTPLATLGLDSIIVRELVSRPELTPRLLGTALVLKLLGSLAVVGLSVAAIGTLMPGRAEAQILITIIAIGGVAQAFDVSDLWFQSQTSSHYTVLAKGFAFFLASLLRVILIVSAVDLSAFVWVGLAEIVVGALGSAVFFSRLVMPLSSWRFGLGIARSLLASSWTLLLSGVAIMIYMKIDIVMLTQLHGEQETGIYAAALRLSEVWYFIPTVIVSSVTPTIIAARHQDEAAYYRHIERLFRLMCAIGVTIALPVSLSSHLLVTTLFGEAYSGAGGVLAVHIWAAIFVFLGVAQSAWDVAEDFTGFLLFRTVVGAAVNVALNLLLIPPLAALGAAIATAGAQMCAAWLLNLLHPRTRRIFVMQTRALVPFSDRIFPKP